MDKLEEDLRKLYGLPPYNNMLNICYGDGYFAKSIHERYSEEDIKACEEKLRSEIIKYGG